MQNKTSDVHSRLVNAVVIDANKNQVPVIALTFQQFYSFAGYSIICGIVNTCKWISKSCFLSLIFLLWDLVMKTICSLLSITKFPIENHIIPCYHW